MLRRLVHALGSARLEVRLRGRHQSLPPTMSTQKPDVPTHPLDDPTLTYEIFEHRRAELEYSPDKQKGMALASRLKTYVRMPS